MLLAPILGGALVLSFTVVQVRGATVGAPGASGRRQFVDGVYRVRLDGSRAAEPDGFTTRLTGRQAMQLAGTAGVASVTRLGGRAAATVPTLSACDPATVPLSPHLAPLAVSLASAAPTGGGPGDAAGRRSCRPCPDLGASQPDRRCRGG